MAYGTGDSWDWLEYDDPREGTRTVLARIGVTDIETLKVRHFADGQVHAVKYRDQQGQRQLAFCRWQPQEGGAWRCHRLTLVPSYPQVLRSGKEPRFFPVPLGYSPFVAIGGYVIDPLATVSQVRLINQAGQTLAESVEDEMVLFLYDASLFKLFRTQIEFFTAQDTIVASHGMLAYAQVSIFSPPGIWAWPDPRQAVWRFLSTLSFSVQEQDLTREGSIRMIKEQHDLHHYGYAVGYDDLQGKPRICFCGVSQYDSGGWIVTAIYWDRYFIDDIAQLEQKKQQPWLAFFSRFPRKEMEALSERALKAPLGAGVIVDNGFDVAYVRLLDGEGKLVLEDTVHDGLVLFLSEHVISPWLTAELYNHEGKLVGTHGAFRPHWGQVRPPPGSRKTQR